MPKYLGSVPVHQDETPYAGFTTEQMALQVIGDYGQFDGSHHKAWALDQAARVLNGSPITFFKRSWDNGHEEYGYSIGESEEYTAWVKKMRGASVVDEEDPEITHEYEYYVGIAP